MNIPDGLTIQEIDPSSIHPDFFLSRNAKDLMAEYRLSSEPTVVAETQLGPVMDRKMPKTIFAATVGELWVGYLSIEHFSDKDGERVQGERNGQPYITMPFWNRLSPELQLDLQSVMGRIAYVAGISVLEKFRGLNIGQIMLEQMLQSLKPSWVIGQTKNPALPIVWNRAMSTNGMRTGLMDLEITLGVDQEDRVFVPFYNMFFDAYKGDQDRNKGFRYVGTDEISPYIPPLLSSLSDAHPAIFTIMQNLIREQVILDRSKTAVVPIISITQEVFDATKKHLGI